MIPVGLSGKTGIQKQWQPGESGRKRLPWWKDLLACKEERQADATSGATKSEQGSLMKSGQGHWMQG